MQRIIQQSRGDESFSSCQNFVCKIKKKINVFVSMKIFFGIILVYGEIFLKIKY